MTALSPSSHPADILRMAIAHEEESIKFYRGIKGKVADPGALKMLDELIKDETKHKAILEEEMDKGNWPEN